MGCRNFEFGELGGGLGGAGTERETGGEFGSLRTDFKKDESWAWEEEVGRKIKNRDRDLIRIGRLRELHAGLGRKSFK